MRHLAYFKNPIINPSQVSRVEIPIVPPNPIGTPMYDKDKLAWELEPDLHGETLRFRLVHKEAKNIPRNHIRYVRKDSVLRERKHRQRFSKGGWSESFGNW